MLLNIKALPERRKERSYGSCTTLDDVCHANLAAEILCVASVRKRQLISHWINEKNPDFEERPIAKRRINPVPVAKKMFAAFRVKHLMPAQTG